MAKRQHKIEMARARRPFYRHLLLLSAAADLTMPQVFCRGEMGGVEKFTVNAAPPASTTTSDATPLVVAQDSGNQQSPHPDEDVPHDEDCFCCCAHVLLVSFAIDARALEVRTLVAAREHNAPTSSFPSGLYRPPRIA